MFRWLFGRAPKDSFYHPGERLIYSYWDGQKTIKADPLVIYRRWMDKSVSISSNWKLARSRSKMAGKGYGDVVKELREVFNVKPLEDGGLSELETIELMDHFLEFCENIKKNSKMSSLPATETLESGEPSPEGNQAIPSSLDLDSTEKPTSIEKQELLPMESK